MASTGNPYENAKAERFVRTLKSEEVYLTSYQTYHEARAHIGPLIEEVYNTKRLRSALGACRRANLPTVRSQGFTTESVRLTLREEYCQSDMLGLLSSFFNTLLVSGHAVVFRERPVIVQHIY